jgi:hypothetical protein
MEVLAIKQEQTNWDSLTATCCTRTAGREYDSCTGLGGSQLQNNVWSNVTNNLRRANLTFVISLGDEGVQPSSLHAYFTRRFVRALNVPKGDVVSLLFQFEPSRKTVVTPGSRWTRLTVTDHENEDLLATDDKGTTIPETSKTTAWHPKRFVRLSFIHLPQSPVHTPKT